jgi:hypothetical protein
MSPEKKRRRSGDWWEIFPEVILELIPALFKGMLRLILSIFD